MVSVNLIGGLGNQMFQIAACIAFAKRHGLEYHIPVTTKNSHQAAPYFTDLQNPGWDESRDKITYNEKAFHYSPIRHILNHDYADLVLNGYFQSYKYFEDFNLGMLFYKSLTEGSDLNWRTRAKNIKPFIKNSLAIHIRKGDYELYPTKHPVVSVDYISSAIERFKDKHIEKITFFSDNPDWCGQFAHLRKLSCTVVFEYDPIKSFIELMRYENFILSNSTFGYWASIMHTWIYGDNGETVYPEKWFGPDYANKDTKDICPPQWIKM